MEKSTVDSPRSTATSEDDRPQTTDCRPPTFGVSDFGFYYEPLAISYQPTCNMGYPAAASGPKGRPPDLRSDRIGDRPGGDP